MTQVNASQNFAPMRPVAGLEGFQFNDKAFKALTNNGGSLAGRALTAIAGFFHLINTDKKITEQNNEIVKGFFASVSEQYGRDAAMASSMQLLNTHQGRLISVSDIMNINRELSQKADTLKGNVMVKQFLPNGAGFNELAKKFPIADSMAFTRNLMRQLVHIPTDQLTKETIAVRAEYVAKQTLRDSNNINKDGVDLQKLQTELSNSGASVQGNIIHTQNGSVITGQKIAAGSMEKYGEDMPEMQINPALRNHGDSYVLNIPAGDTQKAYELLLPIISADQSPIGKWTLSDGLNAGSKLVLYPATENPESEGYKYDMGKFISQAQHILGNAGIKPIAGEGYQFGLQYFGAKIEGLDDTQVPDCHTARNLLGAMFHYDKAVNLQGYLKMVEEKSGGDVFSNPPRAGNHWLDYNSKLILGDNDPKAEFIVQQMRNEMSYDNNVEKATMIRDLIGSAVVTFNDGQKTATLNMKEGHLHVELNQKNEQGQMVSSITSYEIHDNDKEKVMAIVQATGREFGLSHDSLYNLAKCNHQGSVYFGMEYAHETGINFNSSYQPHLEHSVGLNFNISRNADGRVKNVDAIATSIVELKVLNEVPCDKVPNGYMDTEKRKNLDNSQLGNFGIISIMSSVGFTPNEHGEITPDGEIMMNAGLVDINARMNRIDFEKLI